MNPLDEKLWLRGESYPAYRKRIERNLEVFDEVHRDPAFGAADLELLRRLPPLRVLAIGEDWCPDVYHTLPTWARISEEIEGWELRVFARDEHPELMDAFLWKNDARRIPVYAFYSQRGLLQVWWSGRGAVAQRAVDEFLAGRSFSELSDDEKRAAGEIFQNGYRQEWRRKNFEEILTLLRAFHHLPRTG